MNTLFDNKISVGDNVTCRPDGKVRGSEVKKIYENGDILVNCQCPKAKDFLIKKGKYQLSRLWNNPRTRKEL